MSILVKGVEMPKDCPMCPMSHWNALDKFTGCNIVNGKRFAMTSEPGYGETSSRPDWCPLVEVSDEEDADALD